MSFDVVFVDDFRGQNVAVAGLKPIGKILSAFAPAFILKNVNIIIEANLANIVVAARGKARRRSGFMLESIDYQMGNMTGMAFAGAPYSFAQEKGFTTPTGGRVSANNFFMPSAFDGMRQYIADLKLFLSSIMANGTFAGIPIKSVTRGSVTRAIASGTSAGRGVHKYTQKIALGGGKFRYVYPSSGQSSRFTKVFKPGTGKGFGQVGRKRRTV